MATKDRVTIELYVDDQGVVNIHQAKAATQELTDASTRGSAESKAAAEDFAGALVRKLGIYALLTAAAYKLGDAVVSGFRAGIQAEDQFRLTTIGAAATLTDIAKDQSNLGLTYARNLAYSKDMYQELELAAARHFASGQEGVQAFNILLQKGVVLRKEEIDSLFTIVDKIKLMTAGQASSIQISQELRAMLSGQARATDQLAMILRDRYGAEWEEIVKKHREAGDLITWLAGEFKGLVYAGQDVQGTLTSQKTTMETLLTQVGRAGLAGAYEWIVENLKSANDWLRKNKDVGEDINRSWENIKPLAQSVLDTLVAMGWAAAKTAQGVAAILGGMARLDEATKQMYTQDLWNVDLASKELNVQMKMGENLRLAKEAEKYKRETFEIYARDLGAAPTRPFKPEAGGGTDAAQRKIENLIDSLQKEWAGLAMGSMAQVDAWGAHVRREIERIEGFSAEKEKARTLLGQVESLKKEKIEEDFYSAITKKSGDHYASITNQANNWLKAVGGNAEMARAIMKWYFDELGRQRQKDQLDVLNLQKSQLDALAGALPYLSQQLALKERILPLEAEISRLTLERKLAEMDIPEALKAELRGLQALTEQAKKFNAEMEKWKTGGPGGWASAWAFERRQGMETRGYEDFKSHMGRAEAWLGDTMADGFVKALRGDKNDLKKIGQDMAAGFIQELFRMSARKGFDSLAEIFMPKGRGRTGSSDYGDVPNIQEWDDAAQRWVDVADKNWGAGDLLSASGLQGMAAAASMGLGALGLITGSQELMTAAMVIQTVMMAIQAMEMASSFIPFFHSGGMVAHDGLLVAHSGLHVGLDERLILAQTGEGILPRSSMARLGAARFEALRSGSFDLGGGGGGGGPSKHTTNLTINQVAPDGTLLGKSRYQITVDLVNKAVKHREITMPARKRSRGRR